MYKTDQLFDDILRNRGALKRNGVADKSDYERVWDAFNRYLTETHQKRQTMNVHNFCKIGWKIEEHQGKPRLRPYFSPADSFLRVHNLEAKMHPLVSDRYLTASEELNLSKAAIRYSGNLTKDNIFMGLRAIVHQIGEAAASQQVCIDFELGQLVIKDKDVQFRFLAEIYTQQGLEVPEGAVDATEYRPSAATYGPPTEDALTLNVKGSNASRQSGTIIANGMGGWEDTEVSPKTARSGRTSEYGDKCAPGDASSAVSAQDHRQAAHIEALGRHIAQMEADAAQVISEKKLWEGHLERCGNLEQKDVEWRKTIVKDYADQLQIQIKEEEERRANAKKAYKTDATQHDFPCFKEPHDANVRGYLDERKANLRADLEQQVQSKREIKKKHRQREKELDEVNNEASQYEIKALKKVEIDKKLYERAQLAQAWDQDVRLKTVKKAIQDHHKTPGPKTVLHGLFSGLGNSGCETLSVPAASPRLGTPGSMSDRSSLPGSARRAPLGAAGSLALQRERQKAQKTAQVLSATPSKTSTPQVTPTSADVAAGRKLSQVKSPIIVTS